MKFKVPSKNWTRRFAWVPVRMTLGENDGLRVIWLESYFIRRLDVMGSPVLHIMSVRDRELQIRQWEAHQREIDEEDRI